MVTSNLHKQKPNDSEEYMFLKNSELPVIFLSLQKRLLPGEIQLLTSESPYVFPSYQLTVNVTVGSQQPHLDVNKYKLLTGH